MIRPASPGQQHPFDNYSSGAPDRGPACWSPDVQEKLAKLGAEPMRMTPAQFAVFVRSEAEASKRLVQGLGIKPQPYEPAKQ
jgi:hypothetical protein